MHKHFVLLVYREFNTSARVFLLGIINTHELKTLQFFSSRVATLMNVNSSLATNVSESVDYK